MSQRTIKNYTTEDYIISDLGDVVIPKNGAIDLGGDENRLIELATSDDLLNALSQGVDKFQVNDGIKDLSMSMGIDLIRRIQRIAPTDEFGREVVRSDSRRADWDVVFQGAGDDMTTGRIGAGIPFLFDFSSAENFVTAPTGYKRKRIDWTFANHIYVKEGTFYFYNMPKGSYIDMYLVAPPTSYYPTKTLDDKQNVVRSYAQAGAIAVPFMHWVVTYHMEGSCPMGDELNTESAAEHTTPPGTIFRAEITVPEVTNWEQSHGHWSLEIYRTSYDPTDNPN